MTKTLGKQKASKTITTSLSSINIHYQSRDSPSFKSIFQTWHNCSRLSPPPPCLQSLLHSTRAFDDRGFNRRSLERSINDRSTRARDGTLPFRFFDDVCWKIKWRHPTYDYDFDESSWKRGTNKKKKKKTSRVFEQSSHGLRSKIQKREVKVKETKDRGPWWCHRIVNRFVIAGEGGRRKRSSSFVSRRVDTMETFVSKSCSPSQLVYRRVVRRFFFFFFIAGVTLMLRWWRWSTRVSCVCITFGKRWKLRNKVFYWNILVN